MFIFYIFIESVYMSSPGIPFFPCSLETTLVLHELMFLRKGDPDISFFYPISTPFFAHQYGSLRRAEVTLANLTLLLSMLCNCLSG